MQLGITIPLERFLKRKKPPYGDALDDLFCWELHVILLQGRPALVGVNCGTRFSFVLAGIGPEDKENLAQIAVNEIEASFWRAGIPEEYISVYMQKAGEPEITKTHGRSQVAYLNKAIELLLWNDIAADSKSAHQPVLEDILNRTPTKCTGEAKPEPPQDRLLKKLQQLC